jgi:hypothetical protein
MQWVAILVDPHKALSYQRALATFTRIVGEADSEQRLLQNATAQISRITHIRHVKVLRYRPDQGDLLIEAGVGWKPGVVGHVSFGADRHSSPGRSLQTGAPVVCEDIRNDPEFRYADVLRDLLLDRGRLEVFPDAALPLTLAHDTREASGDFA